MYFDFDDTLPLPDDVEKEFREKAGDNLTALTWLSDHGIESALDHVALIQYGMVWNPETGRYQFLIYTPDHVGPKHPPELAIPIIEDGTFVDLLFISNEMSFARATCRAAWLGREHLGLPVVRLHAHPMDWLEADCTGVCHIEPISRKALKDLRAVGTIECNDIHTALDAWDWGFGADEVELKRFVIDDSPFSITGYIEEEVKSRVLHRLRMKGLPVGANLQYADEHGALIEEMRSEYVYATESRS
jgi:hypothetical protein